jgi:hypothetical protein
MKMLEYKEILNYVSISNDELMEMSNLSQKATGVEDVVIWVGPNPEYHGYRIKVSNEVNKIGKSNCFTITIPELKIIGEVNSKLIDKRKLEKIKEFVKINMSLLIKYSDGEIFTDDLIANLKKV